MKKKFLVIYTTNKKDIESGICNMTYEDDNEYSLITRFDKMAKKKVEEKINKMNDNKFKANIVCALEFEQLKEYLDKHSE